MDQTFTVENTAPATGVLSYTNTTATTVAPLPLGKLSLATLPGNKLPSSGIFREICSHRRH